MSVASVKAFFAAHAPDIEVLELDVSTATVELAAAGHGVKPEQIAKTLAIRVGEEIMLLATKGTARLDNKKFKARFASKPRMLPLDEVEHQTGHQLGYIEQLYTFADRDRIGEQRQQRVISISYLALTRAEHAAGPSMRTWPTSAARNTSASPTPKRSRPFTTCAAPRASFRPSNRATPWPTR